MGKKNIGCWFVTLALFGLSLLVLAPATASDDPPPGAPKAEMGFPPLGAKLVYKTVDGSGKAKTQTFTVLEEGTYNGRPVYQMSDGVEKKVYDKATSSWIATLENGKLVKEAKPHWGNLSFPLWVGKSWTARYDFYDAKRHRTFDGTMWWKVVAYEDVTVPAGTFKAFKLEGRNPYVHFDMWYSPEPAVPLNILWSPCRLIDLTEPSEGPLNDIFRIPMPYSTGSVLHHLGPVSLDRILELFFCQGLLPAAGS